MRIRDCLYESRASLVDALFYLPNTVQAEQGAFYERESVYDQLSNLFYCFQVINRGDLDGTAATAFFRADLLSKGAEVSGSAGDINGVFWSDTCTGFYVLLLDFEVAGKQLSMVRGAVYADVSVLRHHHLRCRDRASQACSTPSTAG
jgi:hypothetical protein